MELLEHEKTHLIKQRAREMPQAHRGPRPHRWNPTIIQGALVGPVGPLPHILEVGMLLTQPSVKNSNSDISTLFQKEK